MSNKGGRWTDGGKVWECDPEPHPERWRTAGIEAQARAEMQTRIDLLTADRDSRIHRVHAAVLVGAAFIAGGRR